MPIPFAAAAGAAAAETAAAGAAAASAAGGASAASAASGAAAGMNWASIGQALGASNASGFMDALLMGIQMQGAGDGEEPDMGLRNSIKDLSQVIDRLATKDGGILPQIVQKPFTNALSKFNTAVSSNIQGDAFMTDLRQQWTDTAWNMSGLGMIEKIPVVGELVKPVKDAVDAFVQAPRAIQTWSESLLQSNLQNAQFNSQLASVAWEAERREILRNIESGSRTSGSTQRLNDAVQDLKDTLQPIQDAFTNVLAEILTILVRILEAVVLAVRAGSSAADQVLPIVPIIGQIYMIIRDWWNSRQGGDKGIPLLDMMEDIVNNKFPVYNPPAMPT